MLPIAHLAPCGGSANARKTAGSAGARFRRGLFLAVAGGAYDLGMAAAAHVAIGRIDIAGLGQSASTRCRAGETARRRADGVGDGIGTGGLRVRIAILIRFGDGARNMLLIRAFGGGGFGNAAVLGAERFRFAIALRGGLGGAGCARFGIGKAFTVGVGAGGTAIFLIGERLAVLFRIRDGASAAVGLGLARAAIGSLVRDHA